MAVGKYDFVVLGAGGTGMAAGMYAARLGLRTLVLGTSHGTEKAVGGVITTTNVVENYPGFIRLTGTELADKIEKHAREYKLVDIKEEKAESVQKKGKCFFVKTEKGGYDAKTILFATGTKWRKLEVPGSEEFEHKGVAYCALCDGPLFNGKVVGVVGGSDTAAKDALVLAEHAKKVYIIYRGDKIRAEPVNQKRVAANKKIEIIANTNVTAIAGKQVLEKVQLDKDYKGKAELKLDGLFVAIGHIALSDLAVKLGVKVDKKGEIVMDHKTSETSMPGVYAAGDVGDKPFKQAITGVAEGCTAAHSAFEYISKTSVLTS
jgi:thioredoxin reductase (NADPH)